MYSSSERGRRPASYCASSSAGAGGDQARIGHRISSRSAAVSACSKVGSALDDKRGVDGLLGLRPMIAEVLQRREQVVAQPIAGRGHAASPAPAGTASMREPILQLEDDALGRLLADAGDRR